MSPHTSTHLLSLVIALALLVLLVGCGEAGEPATPCEEGFERSLRLGVYGRDARPLAQGEPIPVWEPLQGGMVAGLNLLATGVPQGADRLYVRLFDPEGGKAMAELAVPAAHFLCQDDEVRLWDRAMIPFVATNLQTPAEVDGRAVRVVVDVRFPRGERAPIVLREEFAATLADRLPDQRDPGLEGPPPRP